MSTPKKTKTKAAKPAKLSDKELLKMERIDNLNKFKRTGTATSPVEIVPLHSKNEAKSPIITGIGDRSLIKVPWSSGDQRKKFAEDLQKGKDAPRSIEPKSSVSRFENASDYIGNYWGFNGPIGPEYDMQDPFVMLDTEIFMRQAIQRRLALIFRNEFQVIGPQSKYVDYINKRLDQIAFVMQMTTSNLFRNILNHLMICSNCFLFKIRDKKASGGVKSERNRNKQPVAGYTFIPPHTVVPYLHHGKIIKWRRYFESGKPFEDIDPEDIIHFYWDKKSGHIYGTPRTVGLREDMFALRRLEENLELLFITHLFPMFHVKVGTPEDPAEFYDGVSELDIVSNRIMSMPKEGVFVTDERTEVEAVGAEGKSLDPSAILKHYKERVFAGLGVSPIDLGFTDSANRSTADNVSQNLKDMIKADLDVFEGQIKMFIFRELFEEAPFSLSVQNALSATNLKFSEVDIDNRLKMENHHINLYNNNLIDEDEARKRINSNPFNKEQRGKTHFEQHVLKLAMEVARAKAAMSGPANTTSTKSQPTNQHGKNPGPTKAKSSQNTINELYDLLVTALELSPNDWDTRSKDIIDAWLTSLDGENSYTTQSRTVLDRLKEQVSGTKDPDYLYMVLSQTLERTNDVESKDTNQDHSSGRENDSPSE